MQPPGLGLPQPKPFLLPSRCNLLPPPPPPAAANEIDRPLIDLLDQNIEGATAAKQEQAAEFMRKVKQAALRYLV